MAINRKELKAAAKEQIKGNILTFFGLSIIIGLILSVSSSIGIGPLILQGPLSLGLTMFILQVVRGKEGEFETGFKGFKQFVPSFVATLLISIFFILWSLLLVIPGIIADNPGISGLEAIKKSKEMMKGHKAELFFLQLSFFWWGLLCVITLGIAAIYVSPYVHATIANFYEKIKSENTAA